VSAQKEIVKESGNYVCERIITPIRPREQGTLDARQLELVWVLDRLSVSRNTFLGKEMKEWTCLFLHLGQEGNSIRQDCLDSPADSDPHFVFVVDCPNADLLACGPTFLEECLTIGGHE
jgi:hypothetical protein